MILQILSVALVLIIVIVVLRNESKKNRGYFNEPVAHTKKEKKILEKYRNEYEPIKRDARLASLSKQKWELEDIAKSATEIIFDAPIPTKEERGSVLPGNLVKMKFRFEDNDEIEVERMWVRVGGIEDGLYVGELDNDPLLETTLIAGQRIWFHANHIFEIDKSTKNNV